MYQEAAFFALCLVSSITAADDTCPEDDLRTVYTSCSEGHSERWQVTVSNNPNCTPAPPVKVASCDKTCPGGQILDFTNCTQCEKGTYSPGDSKVIAVLDPSLDSDISFLSTKIKMTEKSCPQIRVQSKTVILPPDSCWNVVTVSLQLLKPGSVTLEYLYTDERVDLNFNLKTTNSQSCDGGVTIQSAPGEVSYQWQNVELKIPAKGRYLLEIKSTAFFTSEIVTGSSVPFESPRLGKLVVSGVEPYKICLECPAGSVAESVGASECTPCLQNQYSSTASECTTCSTPLHSTPGSSLCGEKVECDETDFLPVVGVCADGKSTVTAKEIEVNKCTKTPNPETYDCSECQPGSEKQGGSCVFCPDGTHNSAGGPCLPCSRNTISLKGLYYAWWGTIPSSWTLRCSDCWVPAGPFLLGRTNNFQPIAVDFGEVQYSSKVITNNVVGLFSMQFKLVCPGTCSLLIIKEVEVTTASGKVSRREVVKGYDESVGSSEAEIAHVQVLQNTAQDASNIQKYSMQLSGIDSYIKLYAVNFTNTVEGGSSYCFPCKGSSCMECAPGMVYQDEGCVKCPESTYHVITGSVLDSNYHSECVSCPNGTISPPGSTSCYTPCQLMTSSGNNYDVTSVGNVLVYDQPDSYPDQMGNRFHYRYKMKLCSSDDKMPLVSCSEDNIDSASGQICQVNVVTSSNGTEVITSPLVKGDMLSGIHEESNGVTLHYTTLHSTPECSTVTTNVTLICNRDQTGGITLTENNICRLSFEYAGPFGCKLCRKSDYKSITSSCADGSRNVTYVKEEGVLCVGGATLPPIQTEECTPYQDSLIDSIKRFKMYVGLGMGVLVLLIGGLCFLAWYSSTLKHKLEGYSRINYANDDNNYMGPEEGNGFAWADSEGEQDEEDDTVYTKYKGQTPGNILADKLRKLNQKLGMKKYKRFGDQDLMQMSSDFGI